MGINALLSKSLGEKRFERANLTASNGVLLGLCSAAVFAVLGIVGMYIISQINYQHFRWMAPLAKIPGIKEMFVKMGVCIIQKQ